MDQINKDSQIQLAADARRRTPHMFAPKTIKFYTQELNNRFADEITDLGYLNGVRQSTVYLIDSNIFV